MKNLFVGNMSFQTTESDLRTLFEPYGEIVRIHIVQDRETGQPRGFAFVEIADDAEAVKAIAALNGKEVAGRALKVNEAILRPERGSRDGGFRERDRGGSRILNQGSESVRRLREAILSASSSRLLGALFARSIRS
jgi:RNA recognition motif-containing protein